MELARLAATSSAVGATRSRSDKIQRLAELFADLDPTDVEATIGLMIGNPRQGRIGIGWATVAGLDLTPAEQPSLTVADIDDLLDRIKSTTGDGSVAARRELLASVLSLATAEELGFLREVLVGELGQGALAGVVTDGVAVAAGVKRPLMRRASMLLGDLGTASRVALTEGSEGLEAIGLTVGTAIEPMLATTATDVAAAMGDEPVSVEWKLDGARIQVHRSGDDVAVFTRNLNDVTSRLPAVVDTVRAFPAHRLVLDGEVMGMRPDGRPQPFQDTMSTFGADEDRSADPTLVPFFFDAMLIDDRQLLDEPLIERKAALAAVVGRHHIPSIDTGDLAAAEHHLAEALAAGHEGVMVKDLDSTYEAGRRGKSWRKVKPVHTLDLVVLAAEWGHGRRQGWLSNLHLGARSGDADEFVMVGKTFKGLTDELLAWQTDAFLPHRREPTTADAAEGRHVVWLEPHFVVEVALDGVQTSTRYPGGVALRFARVRRYRPDKTPDAADTIESVQALGR